MVDAKGDNVIVEQLIRGRTSSGLIVPSIVNDPQSYGRVISVGEKVEIFKVGDMVIFHSNGGMTMVLESKLFRVLKEPEIYGVLTDKKVLATLEEATMKKSDQKVVVP